MFRGSEGPSDGVIVDGSLLLDSKERKIFHRKQTGYQKPRFSTGTANEKTAHGETMKKMLAGAGWVGNFNKDH